MSHFLVCIETICIILPLSNWGFSPLQTMVLILSQNALSLHKDSENKDIYIYTHNCHCAYEYIYIYIYMYPIFSKYRKNLNHILYKLWSDCFI